MGDTSIIARRTTEKYVQYGFSGNGGYFKTLGNRLLEFYDSPEMVDYLFSLGELKHLGIPYSEKEECPYRVLSTVQAGAAHNIGQSERCIFSGMMFVDYGYFYDSDNSWYYVIPTPVRIKLPLLLVKNNLDITGKEFSFRDDIIKTVTKNALELSLTLPDVQEKIAAYGLENDTIRKAFADENYEMYELWEKYKFIFDALDDWCLIECDEEYKNIISCKLKPKSETHIETIEW